MRSGVGFNAPFYAQFRRGAEIRRIRSRLKAVVLVYWRGGQRWVVEASLGRAYADEGRYGSGGVGSLKGVGFFSRGWHGGRDARVPSVARAGSASVSLAWKQQPLARQLSGQARQQKTYPLKRNYPLFTCSHSAQNASTADTSGTPAGT